MVDLPENGIPVMKALLGAPLAWQSPAQIADTLGRDLEATLDLLCNLDEAGWLDVWECEEGPVVTLSPFAAARLCVRIVEVGPGETPRWAASGDPDPPSRRARGVFLSARSAELEYVVDPVSLVEIDLDENRSESAHEESWAKMRYREGPRPRILIGQGLTPWPGPATVHDDGCPACDGQLLQPIMYCLYCDRWGHDLLAAPVTNTDQSKPTKSPSTGQQTRKLEQEQDQIQRERARRKSRRRKRNQARTEGECQGKAKFSVRTSRPEPPPGSREMSLGLAGPPKAAPSEPQASRKRAIRLSSP